MSCKARLVAHMQFQQQLQAWQAAVAGMAGCMEVHLTSQSRVIKEGQHVISLARHFPAACSDSS